MSAKVAFDTRPGALVGVMDPNAYSVVFLVLPVFFECKCVDFLGSHEPTVEVEHPHNLTIVQILPLGIPHAVDVGKHARRYAFCRCDFEHTLAHLLGDVVVCELEVTGVGEYLQKSVFEGGLDRMCASSADATTFRLTTERALTWTRMNYVV